MNEPSISAAGVLGLVLVLKATVLLLAVAVLHAVVGARCSAAMRHHYCALAAVGLVLLPALSFAVPDLGIALPAVRGGFSPPVDTSSGGAPEHGAAMIAPASGLDDGLSAQLWMGIALTVYLVGALLLVVRMALQRRAVSRLARHAATETDPGWTRLLLACRRMLGVKRDVALVRSRERIVPLVWGIRRPSILIPVDAGAWPVARRRAVLLHELAHVARRDLLVQAVADLACALYWFHPGVWWLRRRLQIDREIACDDRVLALGTPPDEYASALLEIAHTMRSRAVAWAAYMADRSALERRMRAVLDHTRDRTAPSAALRRGSAVVALLLVLPLAGARELAPADETANAVSTSLHRDTRLRRADATITGDWAIAPWHPVAGRETIHLSLVQRPAGFVLTSTLPRDEVEGLGAARSNDAPRPARLVIRHPAGSVVLDGQAGGSRGSGRFEFVREPGFAAALLARGLRSPTTEEQFRLAIFGGDLSAIGELLAERSRNGATPPTTADLVRLVSHGIPLHEVQEIASLGYATLDAGQLIRLRQRGVTADVIRRANAREGRRLSPDELLGRQ